MSTTELPQKLGEGSDLQDRISFPTFADCPQLRDYNDDRYFTSSGSYLRHWCFLGEITGIATFSRLVLDVKDTASREDTRVACYDNDGGMSFMRRARPPKVGDTVAVLYAQTKAFLDGSIGIRVE
ncbi:uncharacterized protein PHACADRAFT_182902 [Phanerochaete carnosa HHB-10118-sp]|uniref:Uncharacterized protein n=1 Tax=Phanerochaete carnosa (strain HHB-10118-sp) TaxID=650164 RepID=K5WGZ9_PHACS|nr:uncharacterized protein PHACADRAFT_182902 [Phanerochaete carnosa HHB-10118-sp]EKM58605.1 hypothetical protein PHACADRAFT_182902 [Phanerochaete carnosa HHB-10118-sp]